MAKVAVRKAGETYLPAFDYTQETYATYIAGHAATGCTVSDLGVCSNGSSHVYALSHGNAAKPCVFMTGVIHGNHEWRNAYTLRKFMEYLVTPPTGCSALISFLLNRFRFYCIPCVNPYGYSNASYCNANAVNLNRNFDNGWEAYDDSGDTCANGKGASAFSEVETQFIRDAITAQDPVMFMDFHIAGQVPPKPDDSNISAHSEQTFWNAVRSDFILYGADPASPAYVSTGPTSAAWGGAKLIAMGHTPYSALLEPHSYLTNETIAGYIINWILLACQRLALVI